MKRKTLASPKATSRRAKPASAAAVPAQPPAARDTDAAQDAELNVQPQAAASGNEVQSDIEVTAEAEALATTEAAPEPDLARTEAAADQQQTSAPAVVIEIDPAVSGGYGRNRFDVAIRGRAVSAAAIEEVRLEVGETVFGIAKYGLPERAALTTMPDGSEQRLRSFQFNLPRLAVELPQQCTFRLVARTVDGSEHAEAFRVELDPAADLVALRAGPTKGVEIYGAGRPYALMHIEWATIDSDGNVSVNGWAVALGPIIDIEIFGGDSRIGAARVGQEREDVAAAYPGYPDARLAGFVLASYIDEDDGAVETLRVTMTCSNGFGLEASVPVERVGRRNAPAHGAGAAPSSAPPPLPLAAAYSLMGGQPSYQLTTDFHIDQTPLVNLGASAAGPTQRHAAAAAGAHGADPDIKMFCDDIELSSDGALFVTGWAVCAVGIAQVRVLVDDRDVGLAVFGHEREDVGQIYSAIPAAGLSGFRFTQRIEGRFDGEHTVRVIVRNALRHEKEDAQVVVVTVDPQALEEAAAPAAPEPEQTAEQAAEFRFELDAPAINNGVAVEPVTGRLTIDGWLLSRSGIAGFEVFLDDQKLGDAHYGLARQDVGAAFPEWPNSLRSGYAFHCPPRSLRDGEHTVRLLIKSNSGTELERIFHITVKKSDDQQDMAGIRRRVPRPEVDLMLALLAERDARPSYRFLLRHPASADLTQFTLTVDALRVQAYSDWTALVLAEDDDAAPALRATIETTFPWLNDRFEVISLHDRDRWTTSLAPEGVDFCILLTSGDEPGADALLELAVAAAMNPDSDLLYGDEVRLSPVTKEREGFFKPDFSPDLLYSTNYIGRPWAVAARLLSAAWATPESLVADGEYDLVLRCTELAEHIHHVPKLLCQRGAPELDTPAQEEAALVRMLARREMDAEVLATPIPGTWRLKRAVPLRSGKVSIIIPTCAANGYIETCIKTLREKTSYTNYEIVVIDNIPESLLAWKVWLQQNADKVVDIPEAFNWSIFNNRAAAEADGEFLLFLNDDIEIIQDDWLDVLMEHMQRPEVGIVGPQLLYPDGKVQHAGMFLANNGIGRHAFRFAAREDPGYFGLALTQRNVLAVTGACMLVRNETFNRLGRFDEAHQITNNDLDFCLRVHKAGLLTVFTPYATLIHHELASRAMMKDIFDLSHFDSAWKTTFAAGDPYFNPRLSRHADDYRPDDEPVQWVTPGAPIFHAEDIQRILVVKLDHIGDFVTALPPIRRLKQIFPHASITVLAGPASRAFASIEPAIDTFIPFAFFHARSQLGERTLTKDDFQELEAQLRPQRFDLAIDLRKHVSTRDVLKHTGARYFAGFDYLGQFPFLDVALDWDGDRTLQRKRSHVIDDLLALVNAVGHATETDRVLMQPPPPPLPLDTLPEDVQALFVKPVVAIHPGAGNITKQWPTEHFSALIDLLIERQGVNIMLVGGPDEVEVANALLENVLYPEAVATMAGKTSLADLPRLLRHCALYVGNDSGPKHIAAAVGTPTIGVHSGVVDPVEWGPLGPRAVALRRNMTCSPCYLANADDCPRGLACLRFLEPNLVYEAAVMLLKPPVLEGQTTAAADPPDGGFGQRVATPAAADAEAADAAKGNAAQGSEVRRGKVQGGKVSEKTHRNGESGKRQPASLPA